MSCVAGRCSFACPTIVDAGSDIAFVSNADGGDVGPVVRLEPFLSTEWEENRERLNTVTFELEVNDEQGRDAVKSRTSEIRSEILKLLANVWLHG